MKKNISKEEVEILIRKRWGKRKMSPFVQIEHFSYSILDWVENDDKKKLFILKLFKELAEITPYRSEIQKNDLLSGLDSLIEEREVFLNNRKHNEQFEENEFEDNFIFRIYNKLKDDREEFIDTPEVMERSIRYHWLKLEMKPDEKLYYLSDISQRWVEEGENPGERQLLLLNVLKDLNDSEAYYQGYSQDKLAMTNLINEKIKELD